jgi:hypothetical protein
MEGLGVFVRRFWLCDDKSFIHQRWYSMDGFKLCARNRLEHTQPTTEKGTHGIAKTTIIPKRGSIKNLSCLYFYVGITVKKVGF